MSFPLIIRATPPALGRSAGSHLLFGTPHQVLAPPASPGPYITAAKVVAALPPRPRILELVKQLLDRNESRILANYASNIDNMTGRIAVPTQQALLACALEVFFVLFGATEEEQAVNTCVEAMLLRSQNQQTFDEGAVRMFVGLFYGAFMQNWKAEKEKMTEEIHYIVEEVIKEEQRWCFTTSRYLCLHLGPAPSYVSTPLQRRLILVAMLPEGAKVFGLFPQSWRVVRGKQLSLLRSFKPTPQIWHYLLQSLPKKTFPGSAALVFDAAVWKLHQPSQLHTEILRETTAESLPRVPNPAPSELNGQVLTFLMPNWEQLWKWGRRVELQKRLRYLKEQKKWRPTPEQLLKIIITN